MSVTYPNDHLKMLPISVVNKAVGLGCCIALGTHEAVIGHLFESRGRALGDCPPADLRTYPGPNGFVYVEALTSDGHTFFALLNDE